jgi:undecaprenyl-diphosphatase
LILKAIILGIIEGLTEFLPVSSTGHLIIANEYIKFTGKFANQFDVIIQLGAILAVLLYFKDMLIPKLNHSRETRNTIVLWTKVVVGFLPAAILGFLLDEKIEYYLFNPTSVAIALIVGAILLLYAEKSLKHVKVSSVHDISYKEATIIGFSQCFAMWPGMSRSASTIIGGLFLGLSREAAAEFSFFLALPTLAGAAVLKMLKNGLAFSLYEWFILFVGSAVSFIVAYLVIALFMNYIKTKKLAPFAYYRIILGVLVLILV